MTCIAAVARHGQVYMGADSAGSNVNGQLTIRKDPKIFRNGDFLIGCTGSFRMIQLLRFSFIPPVREEGEEVERFMSTKFVNALRDCFKAGGFASKNNEQEYGGFFLIGYQGRLFCIESDYQVGESIADYDAIGSGDDVALGVLYAAQDYSPRRSIRMALEAAEQHNTSVRGPFHVLTLYPDTQATKDKDEAVSTINAAAQFQTSLHTVQTDAGLSTDQIDNLEHMTDRQLREEAAKTIENYHLRFFLSGNETRAFLIKFLRQYDLVKHARKITTDFLV